METIRFILCFLIVTSFYYLGKYEEKKRFEQKASVYIDNICTAEQQEAIEVVIFEEEQQ